jgi:hypothetical protein
VRSNSPVRPNGCFNCGELGHYANICPKRNMQTPQKDNGQRFGQPFHKLVLGILLIKVTEVNGTMYVEE